IAEDLQNGIAAFILVDDQGKIKRSVLRKEQLRQERSSKQSLNRQRHMSNLMGTMFTNHNTPPFKADLDAKDRSLKDHKTLDTGYKDGIKKLGSKIAPK